ncbi:MAG TPA: SIS domain-containing protein [Natronosporangium sp.]|jgi:D-sedoheptulose 7-phosphate isomerase|nr:SIS domain-containing protein [Natronosporangium sp.]
MSAILDAHLLALSAALPRFRDQGMRLAEWGDTLARVLAGGGRLLVAGNGGSAEQAQHLAAELVGKLRDDRPALAALALCAEPAAVTAISNDYGYQQVFARQVAAHGRPGDLLLLISTSGASGNLLAAAEAAMERGLRCWALTGPAPNPLADRCQDTVAVASPEPQVVQELHLVAIHVLCEHVDAALPAVTDLGLTEDLMVSGG